MIPSATLLDELQELLQAVRFYLVTQTKFEGMNGPKQYVIVLLSVVSIFVIPPAVLMAWLGFQGGLMDASYEENVHQGLICSFVGAAPLILIALVVHFWRAEHDATTCKQCGYDLRGCPEGESRPCPECGYQN